VLRNENNESVLYSFYSDDSDNEHGIVCIFRSNKGRFTIMILLFSAEIFKPPGFLLLINLSIKVYD